ncbi:Bidirectional sugar transporter SWEET12 [Abeliophyllum distichum]|uniref:Bidirectional sugar transporter SWEET12 n=1 Tax=Abeliophyllum distichum TaxID=126358 RepID=A0ABD1NQF9_9LAMI
MALFAMHNPLVLTFGILGNLVSFMVYLAPLPTFYRVFKKKSTEGFHSVPYAVALLSSMIWIYYAWIKSNEFLLITINSVGCVMETIYLVIYIVYAPKKARILTLKFLLLLNFGGFGLILILTHFLTNGSKRVQVLGWICVSLSTSVYLAPLSIMIPNVLGLIFGVLQVILYMIYKNKKRDAEELKLPTHVKPNLIASTDQIQPVSILPLPIPEENVEVNDENADGKVEP